MALVVMQRKGEISAVIQRLAYTSPSKYVRKEGRKELGR